MQRTTKMAVLVVLVGITVLPACSQSNQKLQTFFHQNIGLTSEEITTLRHGAPVATALPSRIPDEVFLFGAVYVHAAPDDYIVYARDFDRLRKLPNYLALGVFSNPPELLDLKDFSFDSDEIQDLRRCKLGDCMIQAPVSSMQDVQRSINWSAPDANEQVNRLVQRSALQFLLAYQRDGNQALGVYNDKRNPTIVPQQFAYMLSYSKALPEYLPDFYEYLLDYPQKKPANIDDKFYWARVKFGLKPTLRIVHVVTIEGGPGDDLAYAIAEKQLYSSHYFETALDLSFCVRSTDNPADSGFYLLMLMGSEQAGLTGVKGSIVRKAAVGRSVSSLRNALSTIKSGLEARK